MPISEIARPLGCATRTVRRWKTLRCVPAVAARLARVVVFGELEQIDKRWAGWRIRGDRLYSEQYSSPFTVSELSNLPFTAQRVSALERELRQLNNELKAVHSGLAQLLTALSHNKHSD